MSHWVELNRVTPSDALVRDSLVAVHKIRNDDISELKELWEEDGDLPHEWYSVLDNLAARLK